MKESMLFLDAILPGLHIVNQNVSLEVEGNIAKQCKLHGIPSAVQKHPGGQISVNHL